MLVNIFELPRQKAPDTETFTNVSLLDTDILHPVSEGFYSKQLWEVPSTPVIGGEVYLANRPNADKPPPLVKSIELYRSPSRLPVVVERIGYNTPSHVLFYKVRYRTPKRTLRFCTHRQLPLIHALLRGMPAAAAQGWRLGDARLDAVAGVLSCCDDERVVDHLDKVRNLLAAEMPKTAVDLFSPDAYDQHPVEDKVIRFFSELVNPEANYQDHDEVLRFVNKHLRPNIPVIDPITGVAVDNGVSKRLLHLNYDGSAPLDTSIPAPLSTAEDDKIEMGFDPDWRQLAQLLENVAFSDFSVEYTIDPYWYVNGPTVRHLVDRYADVLGRSLSPDGELAITAAAARAAAYVGRRAYDTFGPEMRPTKLRLTKTNNEEALVEFFRNDKRCWGIHLDFAMLSLCSLGVSSGNDLTDYPEEDLFGL